MAEEKCSCIFCNSKCPQCGAKNIKVTYSPVFSFHNDSENYIIINRRSDRLELLCLECDALIDHDALGPAAEKLERLTKCLSDSLGIPITTDFKFQDHGDIESFHVAAKKPRKD